MRRNTFPPRPKADARQLPEQPTRKVFNCIVDDTALIDGVKKSTRDGIRKWVAQGAVRLFVPLQTLAQLNHLKKGSERINSDAREAVIWLDEITEMSTVDNVQLEGVDEAYSSWEEVEKFLLPETLLSMDDSESEEDEGYHEDLESSFNALDISDGTDMSSTHSLEDPPKTPQSPESGFSPTSPKLENGNAFKQKTPAIVTESPNRTARNSTEIARMKSPKNNVPAYLQPLFSHILWRIHKETNPDAALESFILLTNDPAKQLIAQKFGIRAKRLEQLRDAVAREDREYKNHLTMFKMESEGRGANDKVAVEHKASERPKSSHSHRSKAEAHSDDEDVVLLKRAPRGPQAQAVSNNGRVWDPNDFGRANQQHPSRGGRGGHGGPRGRGGPPRGGRGGFAPRGAYVPPGAPFRPPPAPRHDPTQPIDPDSFARPAPRASPMRGARRKLWEPN